MGGVHSPSQAGPAQLGGGVAMSNTEEMQALALQDPKRCAALQVFQG